MHQADGDEHGLRVDAGELVRALGEPAAVVELRDGRPHILTANTAMAALFGCPVEDILGSGFTAFSAPEELEPMGRRLSAVIDTQTPTAHEEVRELPPGRLVLAISLAPLPGGRVFAIVRDISVRHAAMERAAELERVTGTGTWSWNLADDSVTWSPQFRRVLCLPEDLEPSLEDAYARVATRHVGHVREMFEAVRDTGRHAEIEFDAGGRDEPVRRIVARAGLVRDAGGGAVRVFGTVEDVTERRRLQRREQDAGRAAQQLDRALQLNDDVVQALARATLALELGRVDEVRAAVRDGTDTVRAIMGELLRSTTAFGGGLRSGDLRRRVPGTVDAEAGTDPAEASHR